ncbi:Bacterial regulatory protein, Fis family [Xanthomonas bromi]|uniref:Bacterial regulatory protein, Fis family n=1 Tax=Xanthomonas bromi TaxID=56449 RepID=A0A1C3NKK9_9XANT|nr:Bacterial regulatory protein, Fis family [Xanthomonas bromi]
MGFTHCPPMKLPSPDLKMNYGAVACVLAAVTAFIRVACGGGRGREAPTQVSGHRKSDGRFSLLRHVMPVRRSGSVQRLRQADDSVLGLPAHAERRRCRGGCRCAAGVSARRGKRRGHDRSDATPEQGRADRTANCKRCAWRTALDSLALAAMRQALEACGGNVARAARDGVSRSTLYRSSVSASAERPHADRSALADARRGKRAHRDAFLRYGHRPSKIRHVARRSGYARHSVTAARSRSATYDAAGTERTGPCGKDASLQISLATPAWERRCAATRPVGSWTRNRGATASIRGCPPD